MPESTEILSKYIFRSRFYLHCCAQIHRHPRRKSLKLYLVFWKSKLSPTIYHDMTVSWQSGFHRSFQYNLRIIERYFMTLWARCHTPRFEGRNSFISVISCKINLSKTRSSNFKNWAALLFARTSRFSSKLLADLFDLFDPCRAAFIRLCLSREPDLFVSTLYIQEFTSSQSLIQFHSWFLSWVEKTVLFCS